MALEPQKVLQELTNSDSDKRKKLDGFTRFCIGDAKDMMDVNIAKRDLESLESETKYDLRKSLAWDSAFSTNPGILEPEELNGCDILRHEENQLLSAKYLEPEIKSVTDEINLRKSLAWDSAFSTCEGVLNPEELSLVNKGFTKSGIRILPRIEELWMSSESNCTIDSERSTLASLEVELFEDIKASMHNLSEASSTLASSSRKERYRNMQKFNSTKNVDGVPKLKVKFRPTSRRQTINGNQPERLSKESSTPLLRKKISAESGVSETSSPLKPPMILGRGRRNIPMAPTKRVSLVSNEVNGERKIVQATNGNCLIVKPNTWKTWSNNPSSSPSSQISSFSPQSSRNDSCSPMSPTSTTDLRCHDSMTSANESCTKSSIDSDDTAESDLKVQPHGQNSGSHDGKGSMSSNPCTEVKGSKSVSSDASRIIKPSCLRMPSPKIGFFDVDDSLVPMENGGVKSHSGVQNTVPKVGACSKNFNGYANRSRPRKIQIPQTLKDITAKIFPQQTRRSLISGTMNSKS